MVDNDIKIKIDAITINSGFDYAKYLGIYKGYDVFQPKMYDDNLLIGRPVFFLVKNNKIKVTKSFEEAAKVLDYFFN